MSRIQKRLQSLRDQGRKALIPYITAGDPHPDNTVAIMHRLVASGADILEIGVPFSDPMADGPVIQQACERALVHGTSLRQVLGMVEQFRADDPETPVVLMGYLNPMEAMGYEAFAAKAREVGVDGVLTVDLPPEEAADVAPMFREQELDVIFLLAPTTTNERVSAISGHGSGYIYYVSFRGVTGAAGLDVDDVSKNVERIRRLTDLPVAVGFGIRDADSAASVGRVADGVIVGSVLVNTIAEHQSDPDALHRALDQRLRPMREALDAGASQ